MLSTNYRPPSTLSSQSSSQTPTLSSFNSPSHRSAVIYRPNNKQTRTITPASDVSTDTRCSTCRSSSRLFSTVSKLIFIPILGTSGTCSECDAHNANATIDSVCSTITEETLRSSSASSTSTIDEDINSKYQPPPPPNRPLPIVPNGDIQIGRQRCILISQQNNNNNLVFYCSYNNFAYSPTTSEQRRSQEHLMFANKSSSSSNSTTQHSAILPTRSLTNLATNVPNMEIQYSISKHAYQPDKNLNGQIYETLTSMKHKPANVNISASNNGLNRPPPMETSM
jgi:hypothetical protein